MKLIKLFLFFFVTIILLSSCGKDKYAEPVIMFKPSSESYTMDFIETGEYEVSFKVTVITEAGIKAFKAIEYIYNNDTITNVTDIEITVDFIDKKEFDYLFSKRYAEEGFQSIGKAEIIFEITDNDDKIITRKVTLTPSGKFRVVFFIKDTLGNNINDAVVKLNNSTYEAGKYVIGIEPGTYNYEVTRADYDDVMGEVEIADRADTINIQMIKSLLLTGWNQPDILLTISDHKNWATWGREQIRVSDIESELIGIKTRNEYIEGKCIIEKTSICEGWVVVNNDNISGITNYNHLQRLYRNGEVISELELDIDYNSKAFSEKYFISKMGDSFKLVHFKGGAATSRLNPAYSNIVQGLVVVFSYRESED